jgi:hypothetical protein
MITIYNRPPSQVFIAVLKSVLIIDREDHQMELRSMATLTYKDNYAWHIIVVINNFDHWSRYSALY